MAYSSANAAQQPAVDLDGRAGDVAPPRRDQQRDDAGDVLDAADAPHRHLGLELAPHHVRIFAAGGEDLLQPLRLDVAGADGVDVDVVPRDFQGQRLGKADDPAPGCDREAEAGDWLNRRDRGDVENGAAAAGPQVRYGGARHTHDVHKILLDGPRPGRIIEAGELAERRGAIV